MSKIIIGLMGFAKSGKDETAKALLNIGFRRVAFGDEVKLEYGKMVNLTYDEIEANKEHHRPAIIALGEGKRNNNVNYWIDKVSDQIEEKDVDVVITDIRRISEVNYLCFQLPSEGYKTILIQMVRPAVNGGEYDEDPETSKAVTYSDFHNVIDYKIINAGSEEDLHKTIAIIINKIQNND